MPSSISRPTNVARIREGLARSPAVAILGPRQCGKTTIARELGAAHAFDLDRSTDRNALVSAPEQTLAPLRGLVVLDEVQSLPELLPVLRVLLDRPDTPARFLLLGSASPDLIDGASQTLAGRVAFVQLTGFLGDEVGFANATRLWHRGGFPRSYLAADDAASYAWRQDFIETFLSHDAAKFGIRMPPEALRRFWTMLAHVHGGTQNAAELARAFGIDQKTAVRYVDILVGTFLVRRLPPWFQNTSRRLVKAPKIFLRDTGLLHALLGLRTGTEILAHPRFGLSWEAFAMEHVIAALQAERDAAFWGTQAGPELDLVVPRGGKLYGFEFKFADAPQVTKSMHTAREELELEHLFVVCPGGREHELGERVSTLPLARVAAIAGAL